MGIAVTSNPKGTKKYLNYLWKSFATKDIIEHEVHEVNSGIFFENGLFSLEAQPLEHSTKCIGFKFKEKDKRRINVAKANKLGFKISTSRLRLKRLRSKTKTKTPCFLGKASSFNFLFY